MSWERVRAVGRGPAGDVLAVVLAEYLLLVGTVEAAADQVPPREPLDAVAFALLVVAGLAFLLRRAPLLLLGAQTLLAAVYLARGHPYGPLLFAVAVAAYLVAGRHRAPLAAAAVVLAAAALVGRRSEGPVSVVVALGQAGWVVLPAVIGGAVGRLRVEAARADREAQQRRVEQERLQLAREVHDVVGHSLSVISLQAGVALHVLDGRPEQAQPALEAIRRVSAEALAELRATLELTRLGNDEAWRTPPAGLGRLDGLVAEVRRCGLPVDVARVGSARDLPAEVDLAALRVVQESLTNVLRHAGRAEATVRIHYEPEHLRVLVTDDGDGPSAGHGARSGQGLVGLRERVQGLGGCFEAGPDVTRGWRVQAVLPTGEHP